jgi:hypothetical protein
MAPIKLRLAKALSLVTMLTRASAGPCPVGEGLRLLAWLSLGFGGPIPFSTLLCGAFNFPAGPVPGRAGLYHGVGRACWGGIGDV